VGYVGMARISHSAKVIFDLFGGVFVSRNGNS
jgi:hypothetical protein